jgi:hypothetical protein
MRCRLASLLCIALISACSIISVPADGNVAKAHAEELKFTVTGENSTSAVVKIGEHCSGEFTSWTAGNGDQINHVFLNGKDIWSLNNTMAKNPDQFRDFPATAECYNK